VIERRRAADNDLAVAEAVKRSKAAVVLGYFFHDESTLDHRLDPDETERRWRSIAGSAYQLVCRPGRADERNDREGVLRWMPLVIKGGDEMYPPLGLLCAWHYLGRPNWTSDVDRVTVMNERSLPMDMSNSYRGLSRTARAELQVVRLQLDQVQDGHAGRNEQQRLGLMTASVMDAVNYGGPESMRALMVTASYCRASSSSMIRANASSGWAP
jgi:hypothetical protein